MRRSALAGRRGKTLIWLLVGLLIGGAAGAGAVYVLKRGKAGIPGGPRLGAAEEVAMIPADSIAFVHLRARDLWKSEEMADLRKVLDKAGPEALKMLDEGFVPAPSTLERATLVVLAGPSQKVNRPGGPPPGSRIAASRRPRTPSLSASSVSLSPSTVDAGQDRVLPEAAGKNEKGKEYFVDEQKGLGIYFPNDKVMVVGMAAGMEEFVKKQTPEGKTGPLNARSRWPPRAAGTSSARSTSTSTSTPSC